ncbi:MAG: Rieske 2Fe-2S domain-containing protein [Phycisphaeraceae bacterium]|jgi:nitrite reductase/ring-hydroxylating ferredoxin subunit|nr:Rieske 2Fe-2S domain-containing protein [Phycisphaeraceae bacterium]
MKRHVLGQLEDIEDGTIQARDVGGRNVVIARHGDRIFALRDVCPHQGAKLSNGVMSCSRKNARVGEHHVNMDQPVIRCPWHNWEYDLDHGTCLTHPNHLAVAAYRAFVEDGQIIVET